MGDRLSGKVAVVTGGGSGIGRATALQFASEGARVCIADLDEQAAEGVAKAIVDAGGQAFACRVDVAQEADNLSMVQQTKQRFGAVHVGLLNAGIARPGTVLEGSVEEWDHVIAINLRGVYLGMRALGAAMQQAGGGAMVATASVAGLRGGRHMPSYFASKHGVVGLVKSAAAELAEHGIRVNAVCPGIIDTPILGPLREQASVMTDILGPLHLLDRVGQPEEVAELVTFLCSDQASFITGAAMPVDGGMTAVAAMPVRSPGPKG